MLENGAGVTLLISAAGDARALRLAGSEWLVSEFEASASLPEYTCVSYSWGRARVPHPLASEQLISARALPAAVSAINASHPGAMWLDAFCVPFDAARRTATLRQMGAIYTAAAGVVIVLSPQCAHALEQITASGEIDEASLSALEGDDWVRRAWTYQECANSAEGRFCAEGAGGTSISGAELLDAVGHALVDYGKRHGIDAFALRMVFPALDALLDTLAEWMIGGVAERTALQVMTAFSIRSPEATVEDRLNAMIGAIDPHFASAAPGTDPASLFLQACEAKGEYSFIYTSAARSTVRGRTWQPLPGLLPAVLVWHSFGDGQRGEFHTDYLELHDMARATPGGMSQDAAQFIVDWLGSGTASDTVELPRRVLQRLRQADFSGTGVHTELEQGLFFPQGPAPPPDSVMVIATGVRWVHGAPALALLPGENGAYSFGDVGVFVGPLPTEKMSVNIS